MCNTHANQQEVQRWIYDKYNLRGYISIFFGWTVPSSSWLQVQLQTECIMTQLIRYRAIKCNLSPHH